MRRTLMRSKIHRATVTEANPDYEGSITIDRVLMDAADLVEHEKVHVVDVDNGARLETYVIPGDPGAGTICLNGAAALLVEPGDRVIIICYGSFDESEMKGHEPIVVKVDGSNKLLSPLPVGKS
jgi:aspartate 1-decarboxylase